MDMPSTSALPLSPILRGDGDSRRFRLGVGPGGGERGGATFKRNTCHDAYP
jgi:hypothetical protein